MNPGAILFFLLSSGLGVNLVLVNPEKAIKLAVNDQARQFLGAKRGYDMVVTVCFD